MIDHRTDELSPLAGAIPMQPVAQVPPVPTASGIKSRAAGIVAGFAPFLHNRKAVAGALMLIAACAVALLAPVISPGDSADIVARRHLSPSAEHWFGTTGAGQDVFDQTVWGARQTLFVGLMVGILTTMLSALIGMTSGYFGGRVDDALSLFTNVFLIIPTLPLLIVLVGFLDGDSSWYFIGVLTATGWSWGARVLRSQTLSLREKDFVSAAEVSGEGRFRIIFGEIFPNMTSIAAANMFGTTIYAIGALSALQFLGLGNASDISWGTNLYWASNNGALITGAWWTVIPSGASIAIVAFALALVNYAVDEVTNPRLRAQRLASQALRKSGRNFHRAGRATPVARHAN